MSGPGLSVTAVVSDFPAPSQTFVLRKLTGLRDAGVEVTVASTNLAPGAAEHGLSLLPLMPWHPLTQAGSSVNRPAWTAVRRGAIDLGAGRRSGLSLKERMVHAPLLGSGSDIVHFEFSGIAVTYRKALERLRPAKLVVSCRGAAEQIVPLRDPRRGPLLCEVFQEVDLIHCVSDDIRRTVEDLGAPPERIVVNRPAVPVADFVPLAERRRAAAGHSGLRILSIGRLHWKKAFDDALRAMSSLRRRGIDHEYRIAGEGTEREKLSFLIDEFDLGASTELLGTCTQERVREELAWADVLLLPSLSEGISNAVLEAMASGLPVVSTDCGGMREVIQSGTDGYLVPISDADAMADHLELLAGDESLRWRIGDAAMARAVESFDTSRQIHTFVSAYESLCTS